MVASSKKLCWCMIISARWKKNVIYQACDSAVRRARVKLTLHASQMRASRQVPAYITCQASGMQAIGTGALEADQRQCSRAREQLLTLAKHVDVPLLPTPTVWPSHALVDLLPFLFLSSPSLSNAYTFFSSPRSLRAIAALIGTVT